MKHSMTIFILILFVSCIYDKTEKIDQGDTKRENLKVICTDSVFLDTNRFPLKNVRIIVHSKLYEVSGNYPYLDKINKKKLNCDIYYSNNSFNRNFNTYILLQNPECDDCQSFSYLYNISKRNGCIIDKLKLSTNYGWENYQKYLKSTFQNDSLFTRIDYYLVRQTNDSGEYLSKWEEKIVTNNYLINSGGKIKLLKTDTVKNIYGKRP